jgi:hypothetical protein
MHSGRKTGVGEWYYPEMAGLGAGSIAGQLASGQVGSGGVVLDYGADGVERISLTDLIQDTPNSREGQPEFGQPGREEDIMS